MANKRAKGEGSIHKRKYDGRWVGKVIVGRKESGTPDYKYLYGATQKEVKNRIDRMKSDVQTLAYVDDDKITMKQWLDDWLNKSIKNRIKTTTWLSYESMIRCHINPTLGGIRLQELTTAHIKDLYSKKMDGDRSDGRKGGLSARTVRYIHQVLTGALKQAYEEQKIRRNPADAVKPPLLVKREMKTLDTGDIQRFFRIVQKYKQIRRYYPAYLLELYTGLRRGELLGLRWKDIDMQESRIKVVQQVVKVGSNEEIRELKTESSQNRIIAIPNEVVVSLEKHRKDIKKEMEERGFHDLFIKDHLRNGLVFFSYSFDRRIKKEDQDLLKIIHVRPRNFIRNFKAATRLAGISDIRFHDMRHTFAQLSIQSGADIKTLQSDLGLESIETTLNKYGHVNDAMKKDASDKRSILMKKVMKGV